MTTKDQERQALAQIRSIVESLGQESYLSFAFEGCFEIAEENIDCDMACSPRDELNKALDTLDKITRERNDLKAQLSVAERNFKAAHEGLESLNKVYEETDQELFSTKQERDTLKTEVIRLKAKLYDLIVKE